MSGILYGIGVGPGEPELMTLKALRYIKESDIIILPSEPKEECYSYRIVQEVYHEVDEKEIICLPFPMIKDREFLRKAHDEIYDRISNLLKEGKNVAFLVIGDPSVYSTYSYIHSRVLSNEGQAYMISGIPSFCAAAAALGISLGDNTDEIHIIPGSYEIEQTMKLKGTRIYMKSGKNLAQLKRLLEESEADSYEVYSVSNCGMENEVLTVGLENLNTDSGYLTLVIVKEKS